MFIIIIIIIFVNGNENSIVQLFKLTKMQILVA